MLCLDSRVADAKVVTYIISLPLMITWHKERGVSYLLSANEEGSVEAVQYLACEAGDVINCCWCWSDVAEARDIT